MALLDFSRLISVFACKLLLELMPLNKIEKMITLSIFNHTRNLQNLIYVSILKSVIRYSLVLIFTPPSHVLFYCNKSLSLYSRVLFEM